MSDARRPPAWYFTDTMQTNSGAPLIPRRLMGLLSKPTVASGITISAAFFALPEDIYPTVILATIALTWASYEGSMIRVSLATTIKFGLVAVAVAMILWPKPTSAIDGRIFVTLLAGLHLLSFPLLRIPSFYADPIEKPPYSFALGIFFAGLLLAHLVAYFLFEHLPQLGDSSWQLFQAKVLAAGKFEGERHPLSGVFAYPFDVAIETFSPARLLPLVIGVWLKIPWAVNPLLSALTLVLLYLSGREIYDDKTAKIAGLLALFSPFLLLIAGEFSPHVAAHFYFTLVLFGVVRRVRTRSVREALWVGSFAIAAFFPRLGLNPLIPFFLLAARGIRRMENSKRGWPLAVLICGLALLVSGATDYVRVRNWLTDPRTRVSPRNLSTVDEMLLEEPDLRAVFFVPEAEYATVFSRVDPGYRGPILFARYQGKEKNLEVCHYYEDFQHFYLSDGEAISLPCPVEEAVNHP